MAVEGNNGLEAIAEYLNLVEAGGVFARIEQVLLIQLLRKPVGGRRPIAQFLSMFRIWGRTRKPLMAEWEQMMMADETFNTGRSRKATDSVWRAEARAEAAAASRSHYLMLMWDVLKACDRKPSHRSSR